MFFKTKWSYPVKVSESELRDMLHNKFLETNTFVFDTDMGKKTREYFGQNMMDHIELSATSRSIGNTPITPNAFIYVKPLNDSETELDVTFKLSAIWILGFVFLYLGILSGIIFTLASDKTMEAKGIDCLKVLLALLFITAATGISHYYAVQNYKSLFKQIFK